MLRALFVTVWLALSLQGRAPKPRQEPVLPESAWKVYVSGTEQMSKYRQTAGPSTCWAVTPTTEKEIWGDFERKKNRRKQCACECVCTRRPQVSEDSAVEPHPRECDDSYDLQLRRRRIAGYFLCSYVLYIVYDEPYYMIIASHFLKKVQPAAPPRCSVFRPHSAFRRGLQGLEVHRTSPRPERPLATATLRPQCTGLLTGHFPGDLQITVCFWQERTRAKDGQAATKWQVAETLALEEVR